MLDQTQLWKIAKKDFPIQSKKAIGLNEGVSADDEVGNKPSRLSAV